MTTYSHLGRACDHCGRVFYATQTTGRPRRFCCNACKQAAYRRAKDDERGRRITEEARRTLAQSARLRNAASGPGGGDRRFDVTEVNRTGYKTSEGQITHGAGAASNTASPGQPARTVTPC